MYPNLGFFFKETFGFDIPILNLFKTFGFFLALAFITAGIVIVREFKRRERLGLMKGWEETTTVGLPATWWSILFNGFFAFFASFKIVYIGRNADLFDKDPFGNLISFQGDTLSWIVGLVIGLIFAYWKYYDGQKAILAQPLVTKKLVMPHQRVSDLVVAAAVSGLVGAKVFAIIEDLPTFFANPLGTFFSGSGLAIYGGLIGGMLFVPWYARRYDIAIGQLMDASAPGLIIAYGVGRLGCHFSGDGDWGIPNLHPKPFGFLPDWLWGYTYPNNVLSVCDPYVLIQEPCPPIAGCEGKFCAVLSQPVYPTSVYEFLMAIAIFAILIWIGRKPFVAGTVFWVYLMLNGVERFTIEQIRVNHKYEVLGLHLTQAEMIAIGFFVVGSVGLLLWQRRAKE